MDINKKQVLFIVNPISGVNQSRKSLIADLAAAHLDSEVFDWEIMHSESATHVQELSREAAQSGVDIIVAVGGDGTVNQVVKGLIGSNSVLGLIPAGSGNGLARHLGIPLDTAESMQLIAHGNTRLIDTVNFNNDLFVSIAGVGFDALVARQFSKASRRGFLSYLKIATQKYTFYRPRKYRMEIDGRQVERQALFVSFANTNQFGYNTMISPDAKIDDGLVDVCIVKKVPLVLTPYVAGMLLSRRLESTGFVEVIRAREINMSRNKNRVVNIDGEPVKLNKQLHISVNPLSLKVIVP
ncbi:MAG: diacylglycerol kinase [Bacteroidetes bacterium HGW-Bacteroidetes-9]|jgi:YegS/Rv2252/BmrU family lipid kinase|nr:MAG: diacylglycerol kinase [Bacteroidetes bacterium HGW-Bacteroidetes-9]